MSDGVQVSDGGVRVRDGGVIIGGNTDPCCCGTNYRQARSCGDSTLADVWMTTDDAATLTGAFSISGTCYYFNFADATSATPGTLYVPGDVTPFADCSECADTENNPCKTPCCQNYQGFVAYYGYDGTPGGGLPGDRWNEGWVLTNQTFDPAATGTYRPDTADLTPPGSYAAYSEVGHNCETLTPQNIEIDRAGSGRWEMTITPSPGSATLVYQTTSTSLECPPMDVRSWEPLSSTDTIYGGFLLQLCCQSDPQPSNDDLPDVIMVDNFIGVYQSDGGGDDPLLAAWDGVLIKVIDGATAYYIPDPVTWPDGAVRVLQGDASYAVISPSIFRQPGGVRWVAQLGTSYLGCFGDVRGAYAFQFPGVSGTPTFPIWPEVT